MKKPKSSLESSELVDLQAMAVRFYCGSRTKVENTIMKQ